MTRVSGFQARIAAQDFDADWAPTKSRTQLRYQTSAEYRRYVKKRTRARVKAGYFREHKKKLLAQNPEKIRAQNRERQSRYLSRNGDMFGPKLLVLIRRSAKKITYKIACERLGMNEHQARAAFAWVKENT